MGAIITAQSPIDSAVTLGLLGVNNSLAYRVHEIEKHLHSPEYWYGQDGGDTYFGENVLTPWQLTAGTSEAFGTPVQLSNGDEVEGGSTTKKYDLHRLLITAIGTQDKLYVIQFLYGTGVVGDATVLTNVMLQAASAVLNSMPIEIMAPRITCNNKLWAKVKSEQDAGTIDFTVGIHTYVG